MNYQNLSEYNEWWTTKKLPDRLIKPFRRGAYFGVSKNIERKQIISVTGLRRVGKTTLLYQLIDQLIVQKVEPKNILYFSFDEHAGAKPSEVLDIYANEILNKPLNSLNKRVYVFFDEIQKAKNWENQLKKYYDLNYNLKFIISGSASLKIRQRTEETLAGRVIEEKMQTLSFPEFLGMKDIKIQNLRLQASEIKPAFYEYLKKGGFPEFVQERDEEFIKTQVRNVLVDRIVYQDIPEVFKIREPARMMALVKIISGSPGMIIDYENLGSDLGVTRQTASNMLEYLSETFLVRTLYNFSKNRLTSEKKLKRCYISDMSLVGLYGGTNLSEGKQIENLLVNSLDAKFFWRKGGYEVDIVLEKDNELLPIEVKYRNKITKKNIVGLIRFMDLFDVKEGIVLTKDLSDKIDVGNKTITLIPVWRFLLENKDNFPA